VHSKSAANGEIKHARAARERELKGGMNAKAPDVWLKACVYPRGARGVVPCVRTTRAAR
jgi:hypothetical protein